MTTTPVPDSGCTRPAVAGPPTTHQLALMMCLLTALSLLALLGLHYPIQLLPVLLFESAWKIPWFALVAVSQATSGRLDAATTDTVISCSLVVVILAVTPWRYVWRHYLRAAGDRWRR